ncbi:MAG: hypothetical protein OHK0022_21730 [Roseiflexaceae bacterium]
MRPSRFMRLLASAMVVVVIALATTLTGAQSARAADPLTVFPSCEYFGLGNFSCTAVPSGGTGSYSYSWSAYSYWMNHTSFPGPVWLSSTSGAFITGKCNPEHLTYVALTVMDSAGATASSTANFWCDSMMP